MDLTITELLTANWQSAILSIYIIAWVMAAMLSFAVGANDCANSFGTAVGSGTLTLKQACYLAAFFETFGAIFFSAAVGTTIRKGIFDASKFGSFDSDFASNITRNFVPLCYEDKFTWNDADDDDGKRDRINIYINTTYCPLVASQNDGVCTYPYSLADSTGSTEFWEERLEKTDKSTFPVDFDCKNMKKNTAYPISPDHFNPIITTSNVFLVRDASNGTEISTEVTRPELTLAYIHLCAMTASACWQLFATRFSLPVSGTHSIIGALIGGGVAGKGMEAIAWAKVGAVALSWVTSPTLSCLIAYMAYHYVGAKVIQGNDPIKAIQSLFPILLGFVGFLNCYTCLMIQYKNNEEFAFRDIPMSKEYIQDSLGMKKSWWALNPIILAVPFGIVLYVLIRVFVMPKVIKMINNPKVKEAITARFLKEREDELAKETENGMKNKKNLPFDGPIKEESIESSNASMEIQNKVIPMDINQNILPNRKPINSNSDSAFATIDNYAMPLIKTEKSAGTLKQVNSITSTGVTQQGRFKVTNLGDKFVVGNKKKMNSIGSRGAMLTEMQVTINQVARKYHSKSMTNVDKAGDINYYSFQGPIRGHGRPHIDGANIGARKHNSATNSVSGLPEISILSDKERTNSLQKNIGQGAPANGQVPNLSMGVKRKPRSRHASESLAQTGNYGHISPRQVNVATPASGIALPINLPNKNINPTGQNQPTLTNNTQSYDSMGRARQEEMNLPNITERRSDSDISESEFSGSRNEPLDFKLGEECSSEQYNSPVCGMSEGEAHKGGVNFNLEATEKIEMVEDYDGEFVEEYFKKLQVVAACCSALAHGGNDTGNAISPLVGIYLLYSYGPLDSTFKSTWWLFAFGGLFMSVGLFVFGKRCIETMGTNITKVVPSSGFTTSIVAVCVVQVCSVGGLPVSSTHCQVGAVIGIGLLSGVKNVKWSLMKNVALAWILTLPATAVLSWSLVKLLTASKFGFN